MKYKNIFALVFVSFFACLTAFAQGVVIENLSSVNKFTPLFEIGLGTDMSTASSYFLNNGDNYIADTVYYKNEGDTVFTPYPYTTDLKQNTYSINFKLYNPYDFYFLKSINLEFPFTYTSLEEKFMYDSLTYSVRYTRNKDSRFDLEGMYVGLNFFDIELNPINFKVFSRYYLPFYKYKEQSDSTDDLIYNKQIELGRSNEFLIGGSIFSNFETVSLGLTGIYEMRSADFADRILTNFHFGFSSVKNTEIYLDASYVWSLGDYKDEYRVSLWRTNLYEKYSNIGLGFKIFFTENFYANVGYRIKVWGENSIAKNTVLLKAGYIFSK